MPKKSNIKYNGRVCVRVYLGKVDGKPKYKACYGSTQKEAEIKAEKVREALRKGLNVSAERETFKQWAEHFLSTKESEVSESHYKNYVGYVKKLEPLFDIPISKIRTADIQSLLLQLAKESPKTHKPISKRTLKAYKDTVSQIMQLAIDNRIMDYNPTIAVKMPSDAPVQKRRALTDEEQKWIIETPHRAQRAAMIMMFSGLRRGELVPLTWQDIDLGNGTIRVNKSVEMLNGTAKLKAGAKTSAGSRLVNIPRILIEYLSREREEEISRKTANMLVCPSAAGKMMSDTAWRRMWESYLIELNFKYGNRVDKKGKIASSKYNSNGIVLTIPNITAHWLRHTFATMLYLSGVDVLTAKEQLGHSDIKTTLDIYTHLDQEYKQKSIDKLDDYIARRAK